MRQSKLFTKTNKDSKEFESINATLLIKSGFIDQTMAGVYSFLPLGLRVLNKIENIVREEINKIGVELLLPALSPTSLWEQTDRINSVDVLYKVEGANKISKERNDATYILNSTQEELITPIAKKFCFSYKDLPFGAYQIQNKFRNEARPKSGLMRGREFRMNDLYSFHKSEDELKEYYEISKEIYTNIYQRLGLGEITHITLASGGDFTKDYSHEFQTRCETGEDTIFHAKKAGVFFNKEVAPSKVPQNYNQQEQLNPLQKIETVAVTGVQALANFLKIPVEKCVKTMIYETDKGTLAVALRGDYEINEVKLKRALDLKDVKLASEEVVKKATNADIGYAGLIGLQDNVVTVYDDSLKGLKNFECGGNETNTHLINVNFGRDLAEPEHYYDIKEAKIGDLYFENDEVYEMFKGSEVGNIFPLNTKFSDAFNYTYKDDEGVEMPVYMGSYGIGTTRLMGVLVEIFHDEKGLIWPEAIAPFRVHLIGLNLENESVKNRVNEIYDQLMQSNTEVLFDDREGVSAGEKFTDADLIGCPLRVVVSKKTEDMVEVKRRNSQASDNISLQDLMKLVSEL